MLHQILTSTPHWVWVLLIALLWLGLKQKVTRTATLRRVTVIPLAMSALSLYSTANALGAGPENLLAWLVASGLAAIWVFGQALPPATRYTPATQRFTLPGSWVPLLLMLGIFTTRYAAGALTATHPALLHETGVGLCFSALYGVFSGIFLARAARLWRLVLASEDAGNEGTACTTRA